MLYPPRPAAIPTDILVIAEKLDRIFVVLT